MYDKEKSNKSLLSAYSLLKQKETIHDESFSIDQFYSILPTNISSAALKEYFDETGVTGVEARRSFLTAHIKDEPLWEFMSKKMIYKPSVSSIDNINTIMQLLLPSPDDILKKVLQEKNIRTKKEFDAFRKEYLAMKEGKTQRTMRFGRFLYGQAFKDTAVGYKFPDTDLKTMKAMLVEKSILVS